MKNNMVRASDAYEHTSRALRETVGTTVKVALTDVVPALMGKIVDRLASVAAGITGRNAQTGSGVACHNYSEALLEGADACTRIQCGYPVWVEVTATPTSTPITFPVTNKFVATEVVFVGPPRSVVFLQVKVDDTGYTSETEVPAEDYLYTSTKGGLQIEEAEPNKPALISFRSTTGGNVPGIRIGIKGQKRKN
jgi:hypothetical protein